MPSGLAMSMARPRLMWAGWISVGLPSIDVEAVVHLRHRAQRLDQRVADQVGEGDLAAAGAGEVVVDDGAVVPQQLDGHRADRGRRRHRERGVHVLRGPGGRAAEHGVGRLVLAVAGAAGGASLATGVVVPLAGSAAAAAGRGVALGAAGSAFFAAGCSAEEPGGDLLLRGGGLRVARCGSRPSAAPGPAAAAPFPPLPDPLVSKYRAHSGPTLAGSASYCSRISSTSHSLAPRSADGSVEDWSVLVSLADCATG